MNGIKAIRTQLGMSQEAFGEALEMTQGNVWHYENRGQAVPPAVAAKVIALAESKGLVCTFNDVYSEAPQLRRMEDSPKVHEGQGA